MYRYLFHRDVNFVIFVIFKKTESLQRLLETKLQTAEQAGSDSTDKGGETVAAASADEKKATGDNGGESTKKNAACAILPGEEGTKHHNTASSKVNDSQTPEGNADENLITFSRQKLALIQCEYDPKRCGFCEKMIAELKHCKRCKTANYCSKECQTKDWEKRHKKDCKEIRRLQDHIDKKFSSRLKVQVFTVNLSDQPHNLERNMDYSALYFHQGKLLMSGFQPLTNSGRLLDVYPETFEKERTVTMVEEKLNIAGLCVLTIENAQFVAISIHSIIAQSRPSRVELWAFPIPAGKPVYTFTNSRAMYGPMCFSEGKLLIRNEGRGTLDELDASSIPFRPTGARIPTGNAFPSRVQSMCLIRKNNDKQIVLQYLRDDGWEDSRIKCINYEGQELWQLGGLDAPHLDGRRCQPYGICVDEEGNIYSAEQESNRVIVIKRDLSVQVLLNAPGSVSCVVWCDQTQKLYVVYHVSRGINFQVAIAGYKVTKE